MKNPHADPVRTATAILALPPWETLHRGACPLDALEPGERLVPASRTEEHTRAGAWERITPRCHYDVAGLPDGTVLVISRDGGRNADRAVVLRAGEAVPVTPAEAEDLLDPAGAGRRAWRWRVRRSRLTTTPVRYPVRAGHEYETDTVYDWAGQEHVALCVRATARRAWIRAVTHEEAVALGVA